MAITRNNKKESLDALFIPLLAALLVLGGMASFLLFRLLPSDDPDTKPGQTDGRHDESSPLSRQKPHIACRPDQDSNHANRQHNPRCKPRVLAEKSLRKRHMLLLKRSDHTIGAELFDRQVIVPIVTSLMSYLSPYARQLIHSAPRVSQRSAKRE
jgi:hypothetical protein